MAYPDRNYRTDRRLVPKALYALGIIAAIAVLFLALSVAHMTENSVTNPSTSTQTVNAPPRTTSP